MADIWDGGTGGKGVIKWEFNTDLTAIRFSRLDALPWAPDIPQILTDQLVNALKRGAEDLERMAGDLDKIDPPFAQVCRDKAASYRAAGDEPPPPQVLNVTAAKPGSFPRSSRK